MPNSLNLSRVENQPETRTRSCQTSIVQCTRLVHPVDNSKHILQKKVRFVANRRQASIGMTSKMLELSKWPTLSLFLDTSVEQIGPIFPGRSSLSSVHIIPKELPEELTSEVMQALSKNLALLPPS